MHRHAPPSAIRRVLPLALCAAAAVWALLHAEPITPPAAAPPAATPAAATAPATPKKEDGVIYLCNFEQGPEGWASCDGTKPRIIDLADAVPPPPPPMDPERVIAPIVQEAPPKPETLIAPKTVAKPDPPAGEEPPEDPPPGTGKAVRLQAGFPEKDACLRLQRRFRWKDADKLQARVFVPTQARGCVQMTAFLVDADFRWYQSTRLIEPAKGRWSRFRLDISPTSVDWAPVDHFKPWGGDVTNHIREFGFKIFGKEAYAGPVHVTDIMVTRNVRPTAPLRILNYRTSASTVPRHEKFEITFSLSRGYDNPFSPDEIDIAANFISPSGEVTTVPAFYYQNYIRSFERNKDVLKPLGRGEWKIRFAPRHEGEYRYMIAVNDGDRLTTHPRTITCTPSTNPGYVRVSPKDPKYFEFDNGDFFYPIGHNIPATYNVKAAQQLGLHVLQHEGTFAYDRFLKGMGEAGENFARIWLAAWSFGLEWSTRYDPAYRGLGRYNTENAWRLDYVLDQCRRRDIYVQLTLTTFGHYRSETKEGDWPYSPYNTANGGFLYQPQQFWSSKRAQKYYQQMLRYVMARWGYSTTVASWELSNEIDLVTGFKGMKPAIVQWHTDCADWIKRFDQGRHLITTNFANWGNDDTIIRLPAIDYTSTNRYHTQVPQILNEVYNVKSRYGKPALVAETGEDFKGSSAETTERYIQVCIWTSYMMPFAGSALQWWWDFIEDRDLYFYFTPLVKYAEGEDRRGRDLAIGSAHAVKKGGSEVISTVAVRILKNRTSAYAWVYDTAIVTNELVSAIADRKDVEIIAGHFANGAYTVEYWDTFTGKVIDTEKIATTNGSLRFALPPFRSNIALKIKPAAAKQQ